MRQYLCTRYPADKKNGGVSRAWLLKQLPEAKYPNPLLEVALHPLPPAIIAIRSGMTEDFLISAILGDDKLCWNDLTYLRTALKTFVGYPSKETLAAQTLSLALEICDPAALRETRGILRKIRGKHPALRLLRKLMAQDNPPTSAVMMVDAYADFVSICPKCNFGIKTTSVVN